MCCLASLGCGGVRIGPQVETRYVIQKAGKPFRILGNVKVNGRLMDDDGATVIQDVGGWVTMPPEHWEAVQRALEKATEKK